MDGPEAQALFALPGRVLQRHRWAPSVASEALWQHDRLELFDIAAQLQRGVERLGRRAVYEAGGQVVPPFLKPVQPVRQRLDRVSPPDRTLSSDLAMSNQLLCFGV